MKEDENVRNWKSSKRTKDETFIVPDIDIVSSTFSIGYDPRCGNSQTRIMG